MVTRLRVKATPKVIPPDWWLNFWSNIKPSKRCGKLLRPPKKQGSESSRPTTFVQFTFRFRMKPNRNTTVPWKNNMWTNNSPIRHVYTLKIPLPLQDRRPLGTILSPMLHPNCLLKKLRGVCGVALEFAWKGRSHVRKWDVHQCVVYLFKSRPGSLYLVSLDLRYIDIVGSKT